jgi:hypothetical protein
MPGISGLAEKILALQEGLYFMDLVACLIGQLVYWLVGCLVSLILLSK